jgi:cell division septation protein DedD
MSKITMALQKAAEERTERLEEHLMKKNNKNGNIKNSWLVWVFFLGVIATVFFAFNYEKGKETIPLSEIFPDESTYPVEVEYEIIESKAEEMPAEGKAIVAVEEVKVVVPVVEKVFASVGSKNYAHTIQVASFKTNERAQTKLKELEKKGFEAFILQKNLGDKGIWHRVYVGKYQTKSEADQALINVQKNYKNSFIISPRKTK